MGCPSSRKPGTCPCLFPAIISAGKGHCASGQPFSWVGCLLLQLLDCLPGEIGVITPEVAVAGRLDEALAAAHQVQVARDQSCSAIVSDERLMPSKMLWLCR